MGPRTLAWLRHALARSRQYPVNPIKATLSLQAQPNEEVETTAPSKLIHPRELDFLLREFLDLKTLAKHSSIFRDLDVDTAHEIICAGHTLAESVFAPVNALGDRNEPIFDRERDEVVHPSDLYDAQKAYAEGGFVIRAHCFSSDLATPGTCQ